MIPLQTRMRNFVGANKFITFFINCLAEFEVLNKISKNISLEPKNPPPRQKFDFSPYTFIKNLYLVF